MIDEFCLDLLGHVCTQSANGLKLSLLNTCYFFCKQDDTT